MNMPTRPPNILLVVCDEMRWCDVGAYGSPQRRRGGGPLTPAIDRLADGGCVIEHAVSNAPVCLPARSVVLSGQHARTCCGHLGNSQLDYESTHGRRGWLFDPYAPPGRYAFPDATLPELLRDGGGYHTRVVGKWHVDAWPHHVGFDDYCIARTHHANSGQLYTRNGGPEFAPPAWGPDFEVDECAGFLRSPAAADRPWFLHLNLGPPHMPLADMPRRYLDLIDPDSFELRGNVPAGLDLRDHEDQILAYLWDYRYYLNRLPHACELPPGLDLKKLTAMYLGAIGWVDDVLARLLDALHAGGFADDMLICFTSDHGDMLGSHDMFGKASLYQEAHRIPMIFSGSGVEPGRRADDGVGALVDLCPTFLRAAGLEVPGHVEGRDLGDALAGRGPLPGHAVVEAGKEGTAVRTADFVYGLPRRGDLRCEPDAEPIAFDLGADPLQLGRADPAARPDLRDALLAWDAARPPTPMDRFPVLTP